MEPVDKKDHNPILLGQAEVVEIMAESGYKFADLIELHKQGILQEANRLFFHPLGLAMVWLLPTDANDPTEPTIVGLAITADPEGWAFTDLSQEEHKNNADSVEQLGQRFFEARAALFGNQDTIQPIGSKLED